jgi:transcriptional regulator with XRE-family HTH domain
MNLDDRRFLGDLAVRLRQRRLARRWTQANLAQRCELHRTFIGGSFSKIDSRISNSLPLPRPALQA